MCTVSCRTYNPPIVYSPQEGYQRLIAVKLFAFGGIGIAGQTSQGELAFRAVLKSNNAVEQFRAVLSEGTDAAKLYALCGIRVLDRSAFETEAAALRRANPAVTTMSGCMIGHEKAGDVVQEIATGVYDLYLPKSKCRSG